MTSLRLQTHPYWWFFTLLQYSNSASHENNDLPGNHGHQSTDDLVGQFIEIENSSSSTPESIVLSLSYEFIKFKLGMKVATESYCETTFSRPKVEILLDFDMKCRERYENWWRQTSYWNPFFATAIRTNPSCSDYPGLEIASTNSSTLTAISEHEFFQSRNIRIPIKMGRKGKRLNKYEHLKKDPVWKTFLECDCEMIGDTTVTNNADENVCVHGKIVNLSRGVGGDRSFFVHAPNSAGSYSVVAHICFK